MTKIPVSAVIVAKNEEAMLPDCLASVSFCSEIVVVDSGSTDRTVEIASRSARVIAKPFVDFASQKNFAIGQARFEWILSIDADERTSPGLQNEILSLFASKNGKDNAAYRVPRVNHIFGRRFRTWRPGWDSPVRLFKKNAARYEGAVHETLHFQGALGNLKNELIHLSTADTRAYFRKLNHYTDLEARRLAERQAPSPSLLFKPAFRFLQNYFSVGILNGREGFVFSALSGYYEFVRSAKFLGREGISSDTIKRMERRNDV